MVVVHPHLQKQKTRFFSLFLNVAPPLLPYVQNLIHQITLARHARNRVRKRLVHTLVRRPLRALVANLLALRGGWRGVGRGGRAVGQGGGVGRWG